MVVSQCLYMQPVCVNVCRCCAYLCNSCDSDSFIIGEFLIRAVNILQNLSHIVTLNQTAGFKQLHLAVKLPLTIPAPEGCQSVSVKEQTIWWKSVLHQHESSSTWRILNIIEGQHRRTVSEVITGASNVKSNGIEIHLQWITPSQQNPVWKPRSDIWPLWDSQ